MAASSVGRACLYRRRIFGTHLFDIDAFPLSLTARPLPTRALDSLHRRAFTCARCLKRQQGGRDEEPFSARLGKAWRNTRIEWKPIPIGLGICFLGFLQFLRVQAREGQIKGGESSSGRELEKRPPKRERIRPSGPWQVQVMSTLPLKALSRVWGRFNELHIPYYLRVPGFKLYGWI